MRKFLASWIVNFSNLQFHYSRRKFAWNFPPHRTWSTGISTSFSSPFPCPGIQSSPALIKRTASTGLVATMYTLQSTGIIKKTCKMPTSPVLKANANQRLQFYGTLSKIKQSLYMLGRLWGFQEDEAPRFHDNWYMKAVRSSALRTGRLYPPENIHCTHFCYRDF
jgi:hypothetical protein